MSSHLHKRLNSNKSFPNNSEQKMLNEDFKSKTNYSSMPEHIPATLVGSNQSFSKGEKQPNKCQDPIFAILFYVQLVIIFVVGMSLGVPAIRNDEEAPDPSMDVRGIVATAAIGAFFAFILSAISLSIMMMFAKQIIQFALILSVVISFVVVVLSAIAGQIAGAVIGGILFLMSACYAYFVWSRIPFAAANLNTAITAVRSNLGVTCVAYLLTASSIVYVVIWSLAMMGVYNKHTVCENGVCEVDLNGGIVFLLFVTFYWTEQVIEKTIHVTVAGVVGTWWFDPAEASSCCSKSICDSFTRATTYSFGSICFGSLLVAIIKALRQMIYQARQNGEGNDLLLCIADCLLSCIEGLVEYFNKWAFIYVGLYGYSYLQAGKNVMTLFEARGFTTIITDDLVDNALTLICFVIGALTGCVGILLELIFPGWFAGFGDVGIWVSFIVAFIAGIAIASILLGVVNSAADTVLVCFAEGPAEFQANHPDLCNEMRNAWRDAYPEVTTL